jgi:sn1-specific diacylglycerol lipase
MTVNEAAYFFRYAMGIYSWPYYIYMHQFRGISTLCLSFNEKNTPAKVSNLDGVVDDGEPIDSSLYIEGDTHNQRNLKAFQFLSKTEKDDIVYANFNNEIFLSPFCIVIDHPKKCVVVTIRGTLSMSDVVTDLAADTGYFDVDHLKDQPCHIGILNTAEKICNIILSQNLLQKAFKYNPVKRFCCYFYLNFF